MLFETKKFFFNFVLETNLFFLIFFLKKIYNFFSSGAKSAVPKYLVPKRPCPKSHGLS